MRSAWPHTDRLDSIIIRIEFHATRRSNKHVQDWYLRWCVCVSALLFAEILHNPLLLRRCRWSSDSCIRAFFFFLTQWQIKHNAMGDHTGHATRVIMYYAAFYAAFFTKNLNCRMLSIIIVSYSIVISIICDGER